VDSPPPPPNGISRRHAALVTFCQSYRWTLCQSTRPNPQVEAAEVLAINTLAPFTLNSRLRPALLAAAAATGTTTADGKAVDGAAFVINVSAMEGKVKWGVHSLQREPETQGTQ
jgi:hypothetical protein